jgi:hypothetical protein
VVTASARVIDDRFEAALQDAEGFFMKEGKVYQAAVALAQRLDAHGIPYAIAGAMALGAHGYERMTTDVDVLVTREGLARFKQAHLGREYVEKFPGSKGMRDTENGVTIDILIAGEFPGDGRPKPVVFPEPTDAAVEGTRFRILTLPKLVELKLASGMTAPHRLKDLADVLELVRAAKLTSDFAGGLDPFVREKYLELWRAAQTEDPE